MADTRVVTGTILLPNGEPNAGASVKFSLFEGTFTTSPPETFPKQTLIAIVDSVGQVRVPLVAGLSTYYVVELPDGSEFPIIVAAGSDITLEALRELSNGAVVPLESLEQIIEDLVAAGVFGVSVQEGGTPKVADLQVANFNATHFNVSESPAGKANVDIAFGTSSGVSAEGNHLHDSRYYTESEIDAIFAATGLVRLSKESFTGVTSYTKDSIFTSTYRNYRIVVDITALSVATGFYLKLRASGTSSSVNYDYGAIKYGSDYGNDVFDASAVANDSGLYLGRYTYPTGQHVVLTVDLNAPQATVRTLFDAKIRGYHASTAAGGEWVQGGHRLANAYDGFTIITDGAMTMTGTCTVYAEKEA